MIIADVLGKKSLRMVLVQSDNVVEHIAAAASDPALGNAVLPRALGGRFARTPCSWIEWQQEPPARTSGRDPGEGIWEWPDKGTLPVTAERSNCWWDAG